MQTGSRDPYGAYEAAYGSAPSAKSCCYHPDATVHVVVRNKTTNLTDGGSYEDETIEYEGAFDEDSTGDYTAEVYDAGTDDTTVSTSEQFFRIESDDFAVSTTGSLTAINIGAAVLAPLQEVQASTGCAGHTAHYVFDDGVTRNEVWVTIEITDLGY